MSGYGAYHKRGGSRLKMGDSGPPSIRNSKSRGVIIRHREYISDIQSSQVFANFNINGGGVGASITPGNNFLFPWLSQIAENFEEWIPRGIVFQYKTTSTDLAGSAANPSLGTVIMATEYNPYNSAFGNKVQMENYQNAQSCKPSVNMFHAIECARGQTPISNLFVRTGPTPAGADTRLYDLGLFQIAVSGMQSAGFAIGELWVTYEIELLKPKLLTGVSSYDGPLVDHFNLTAQTAVLPGAPLGTNTTLLAANSGSTMKGAVSGGVTVAGNQPQNFLIPVLIGTAGVQVPTGAVQSSTASTYYFGQGISGGTFMIQYWSLYTTPNGGAPTVTVIYTNCKAATTVGLDQDTNFGVLNTCGTTSTTICTTFFVTVTAAYANVQFGAAGAGFGNSTNTNFLWADLYVVALPFGIT